jgi:hypothetical protein
LEGFVRYKSTGEVVVPSPVSIYVHCSGFVVNSDGYVVTSKGCVSPSVRRAVGDALDTVANEQVAHGQLTSEQRSAYVLQLLDTTQFTGQSPNDPPKVTVEAQMYNATADPDAKRIPATVVDTQATAGGETALVKLDRRGLPVVQLAEVPLNANLHVVLIDFDATNTSASPATYLARSESAVVAAPFGNGTPPRYLLDKTIGYFARGGMVTNEDGKVIGMITADTAGNDEANKLVAPAATVVKLLNDNRLSNELGPADKTYRDGLNAYYGGRYKEAISDFDAVLAAMPDNSVAQSYRTQAQVRLSVEGDSGSSSGTVTVILAVVGGVLVLGLMAGVVFLVIRGRRREREFMYFEPYASPQLAQITAGPTSSAPASGPLAIAPVSTVPTSAVPASPYAPPVSSPPVSAPQFSGPPVSAPPISGPPGGYYYPPPTATYPVVPVPPPTPMAVSPQYGQALPEPVWATPAAPVPVPEPPTDPAASSATAPTAPAAGTPEQYAAQPWEPPDEDRTIGSPPDAYRHRP